ncbi:hypothetical protein EVAR_53451_1 [Eumeta japonica]|uniref:Uncharacterized protein n=1 Tax=Eumeta variegata TaxID=151549 RepID=A0A4C1XRN0_EUMVA|nr:hypothetical protein EVAR_53451_1 [Eumeta japonica]
MANTVITRRYLYGHDLMQVGTDYRNPSMRTQLAFEPGQHSRDAVRTGSNTMSVVETQPRGGHNPKDLHANQSTLYSDRRQRLEWKRRLTLPDPSFLSPAILRDCDAFVTNFTGAVSRVARYLSGSPRSRWLLNLRSSNHTRPGSRQLRQSINLQSAYTHLGLLAFTAGPPPRLHPWPGRPRARRRGRRALSCGGGARHDADARGALRPPPSARRRAHASATPGICTTIPPTSRSRLVIDLMMRYVRLTV